MSADKGKGGGRRGGAGGASGGGRRSGGGRSDPLAGGRKLHTKVRSARRRKTSSTRWLQRQLNDPYVLAAKRDGYRSRAAYKLIQLDDKFAFLGKGKRVVDLGAAPGGWTQIAVDRVKAGQPGGGKVVGIDLLEMEPVENATLLTMDFLDEAAPEVLKEALDGPADVVLSDMAAATTGHQQTDHLRIVNLLEVALMFAEEVLVPGGCFVAKVFRGGAEDELLKRMRRVFRTVKHFKPPASRKESPETYVVAMGYRGDE